MHGEVPTLVVLLVLPDLWINDDPIWAKDLILLAQQIVVQLWNMTGEVGSGSARRIEMMVHLGQPCYMMGRIRGLTEARRSIRHLPPHHPQPPHLTSHTHKWIMSLFNQLSHNGLFTLVGLAGYLSATEDRRWWWLPAHCCSRSISCWLYGPGMDALHVAGQTICRFMCTVCRYCLQEWQHWRLVIMLRKAADYTAPCSAMFNGPGISVYDHHDHPQLQTCGHVCLHIYGT